MDFWEARNQYFSQPWLLPFIQDTIIEASNFIGLKLWGIEVFTPPPVDDLTEEIYSIRWRARTGQEQDQSWVMGSIGYKNAPDKDHLKGSIRKSVTFATLVSTMPEGRFITAAMDCFRYDQKDLLRGALYMWLTDTMIRMRTNSKEMKYPSVTTVINSCFGQLKTWAAPWLSEVRRRMVADTEQIQ